MWQPSWACPTEGCFYPPTLFTDVAPAVDHRAGGDLRAGAGGDDLPHAGRGGRAGQQHALRPGRQRVDARTSTSRSTSRRKIKAGMVWINCTNLFDAAAGFGGYRESGFGREGGREGLYEYVKPTYAKTQTAGDEAADSATRRARSAKRRGAGDRPAADRPHRQAVHRRQAGAPRRRLQPARCYGADGAADRRGRRRQPQGHPQRRRGGAQGRRAGPTRPAHNRAQILYYIAENLARARRRVRRAASPR